MTKSERTELVYQRVLDHLQEYGSEGSFRYRRGEPPSGTQTVRRIVSVVAVVWMLGALAAALIILRNEPVMCAAAAGFAVLILCVLGVNLLKGEDHLVSLSVIGEQLEAVVYNTKKRENTSLRFNIASAKIKSKISKKSDISRTVYILTLVDGPLRKSLQFSTEDASIEYLAFMSALRICREGGSVTREEVERHIESAVFGK